MTGNIDLAPTILELADARAAGLSMDGRPLTPLGLRPRTQWRSDLLLENKKSSEAVRSGRFVYMEHPRRERELYNLRSGPYQLRNLAGEREHREKQRRLARRLRQLRDCAGASCR